MRKKIKTLYGTFKNKFSVPEHCSPFEMNIVIQTHLEWDTLSLHLSSGHFIRSCQKHFVVFRCPARYRESLVVDLLMLHNGLDLKLSQKATRNKNNSRRQISCFLPYVLCHVCCVCLRSIQYFSSEVFAALYGKVHKQLSSTSQIFLSA